MSVEILIADNGPLIITGEGVVLKDAEGKVIDTGGKPRVALCRCGASANKPMCDGAHRSCGFDSKVRA